MYAVGQLRPISTAEGNNDVRTHLLLNKDTPIPREIQRVGQIFAKPHLGHVLINAQIGGPLSEPNRRHSLCPSLAGFGPAADMARFLASIGHTDQQRLAEDAEYDP